MKTLLPILSLTVFATSFAATEKPTFTYQTQIIASQLDCQSEASQWALRFQSATHIPVVTAHCRGEQSVTVKGENFKIYTLGLAYKADSPFASYTVEMGRPDPLMPSRPYDQPLYPTLAACTADLQSQKEIFERQTALSAVVATCEADTAFIAEKFYLRLEGFDKNARPHPLKRQYTFIPSSFEHTHSSRQAEISQFISSFKAEVVKQAPGFFIYYRADGPIPATSQTLILQKNEAECSAQLEDAQALFVKAGSQKVIVWCDDYRLTIVHDGNYTLSESFQSNKVAYGSLEQCLADREFVLSDVRNSQALGAICGPSLYAFDTYSMTLYKKGY